MTEALEKTGGLRSDSRDRRKSKYLSSPYTNVGSRHQASPDDKKDVKTPRLSHKAKASSVAKKLFNGSASNSKLGGSNRFQRNWYRKLVSCNTISSSPDFINTSPEELLSGLYSKAVDCMFPSEHKSFDLVEWFFCRYRVSRYHDEAELATSLVNMNSGNSGTPVSNNLQDIKMDKKRKNSRMENSGKKKMKSLSGLSDVKMSSSADNSLKPGRKLKQNKNAEEVIPLHQPQNPEITLNDSGREDNSVPETPQSLSSSGLSDVKISSLIDNSQRPGKKLKPKKKVKEIMSLHQLQNVEMTSNDSGGKNSSVPEAPQCRIVSTDNSLWPGGKLNLKGEEAIPLHQLQKDVVTLNDSGSKNRSVLNVPQNMSCLDSKGKAGSKKRKMEVAPENPSAQIASACRDAKITKCSSLVVDLQPISQPRPDGISEKSNGGNEGKPVSMNSNKELHVSQEGQAWNITKCGVSESSVSKVGTVLVNKTGGLKNGMEKASGVHLNTKLSTEIPDLNHTSSESNTVIKEFRNVNNISLERKLEQSINLSACVRSTTTLNHSRVEENGETLRTCLLLQFAPGANVPSKEHLMSIFCRFGPLKASETKLMKDTSSAQIVFVRSADAGEAFRSLEQNKPFGSDLVDYKLHHFSAAASPQVEKFMNPTQPSGSMPVPVPMPMPMPMPKPGEKPPSLQFIKQNLLMMTSVMEKSGNNLSPQMRVTLESEIKNLLEKVNSMAGSS